MTGTPGTHGVEVVRRDRLGQLGRVHVAMQPAITLVEAQGTRHLPAAQGGQRGALPAAALAVVVDQLGAQVGTGEPGEHPAGLDLAQLCAVPDRHQLAADGGDGKE